MTYDDVQGKDFRKFQSDAEDRLVLGGSPCTYFNALDNRTITDKAVREAYLGLTRTTMSSSQAV